MEERGSFIPPVTVVSQPIKLTMPLPAKSHKHLGLFLITLVVITMAVLIAYFSQTYLASVKQKGSSNGLSTNTSVDVEFPEPAPQNVFDSDTPPLEEPVIEETSIETGGYTPTPTIEDDPLSEEGDIMFDDLLLDDFDDLDDFDFDF